MPSLRRTRKYQAINNSRRANRVPDKPVAPQNDPRNLRTIGARDRCWCGYELLHRGAHRSQT